jgi:protein O-GlcNAc transferase
MGVPVITKRGHRFGARHSAVHLQTVGLGDWIAEDDEDYLERAIGKASAIAELAALRSQLRRRMSGSALLDGAGFASDFAGIVRELWLTACKRAETAAAHGVI